MSLSKKLFSIVCLLAPLISVRAQYRIDQWTAGCRRIRFMELFKPATVICGWRPDNRIAAADSG
jgi:hypothetical protein